MTEEAVPTLTFGNYRRGKPIQVDIHDPMVAGLIKCGYLKIRWKELDRGADTVDPAGPEPVPAGGVGSGAAGELQEEAPVDGTRQREPEQKDSARPQAAGSSRSKDK